jgi:hypothetical protein
MERRRYGAEFAENGQTAYGTRSTRLLCSALRNGGFSMRNRLGSMWTDVKRLLNGLHGSNERLPARLERHAGDLVELRDFGRNNPSISGFSNLSLRLALTFTGGCPSLSGCQGICREQVRHAPCKVSGLCTGVPRSAGIGRCKRALCLVHRWARGMPDLTVRLLRLGLRGPSTTASEEFGAPGGAAIREWRDPSGTALRPTFLPPRTGEGPPG